LCPPARISGYREKFITERNGAVKLMRAGNAGSGSLIRRRRREVALRNNIPDMPG
jgi:hypothetical protein